MKNRDTGDVFFVVVFTLVPKEEADKEDEFTLGSKPESESKGTLADWQGGKEEGNFQPRDDDLD